MYSDNMLSSVYSKTMTGQTDQNQNPDLFAALFDSEPQAKNTDFSIRAVSLPNESQWQPTAQPNLYVRVLEYVPGSPNRLTAIVQLQGSKPIEHLAAQGVEMMMLRGQLDSELGSFGPGHYLRNPIADGNYVRTMRLSAADTNPATINDPTRIAAECYVSIGQLEASDTRVRKINSEDQSLWLPGPEEGIDVLPLHLHNTSNAMLIRWNKETTFRPKLDPLGEEILVLSGKLMDRHGEYEKGSWIRNPILAWQSWAGTDGTVVYYKNGHF